MSAPMPASIVHAIKALDRKSRRWMAHQFNIAGDDAVAFVRGYPGMAEEKRASFLETLSMIHALTTGASLVRATYRANRVDGHALGALEFRYNFPRVMLPDRPMLMTAGCAASATRAAAYVSRVGVQFGSVSTEPVELDPGLLAEIEAFDGEGDNTLVRRDD